MGIIVGSGLFFLANCGLCMLHQVHRFPLVAAFLGTVALADVALAIVQRAQQGRQTGTVYSVRPSSSLPSSCLRIRGPAPGTPQGRLAYGVLAGSARHGVAAHGRPRTLFPRARRRVPPRAPPRSLVPCSPLLRVVIAVASGAGIRAIRRRPRTVPADNGTRRSVGPV